MESACIPPHALPFLRPCGRLLGPMLAAVSELACIPAICGLLTQKSRELRATRDSGPRSGAAQEQNRGAHGPVPARGTQSRCLKAHVYRLTREILPPVTASARMATAPPASSECTARGQCASRPMRRWAGARPRGQQGVGVGELQH
jgi:hypothetical protein